MAVGAQPELDLLRTELRHLRSILESITDSFIAVDREWRLTYASSRVLEKMGTTAQDAIGRNLWEFAPEAKNSDFYLNYQRVMRDRVPARFEMYYPPADSWYDVHAYPTEEGMVAYVIDITSRKRSEAKVIAEEAARLSDEVLEQMPDAIVLTDLEGRIRGWLGGSEQVYGYTAPEALGRKLSFLHSPDLGETALKKQIESIKTTGYFHGEAACVRKDGSEICIEVRAKSVLDRNGTPIFIIAIHCDVTERKHMEDRLRRNEALLAEAQRVAGVASWEWDMRTKQVIWTDQLYELFGLCPGELAPSYRTFFTRLHPDDRALYAAVVRQSLVDGQPFDMEFRITRADDGRERMIYSRGVFMRDSQGQPIRLIGTAQDITERKLIEDEIRHLNADLERRVAERTADLERSNQDLQQFAYISSHDLQEPLRTVISYTQLLENRYAGRLDEDGMEFLKFIVEGAQRMSDLITDLLAYSRVSNMEEKRTQAVALGGIVDAAVANLQVTIGKTGGTVSCQQLPTVMGDPMQLVQLFQNLIANALKYRSEAKPMIRIDATSGGSFHVIRVSDNGIGIDPIYHDRIFGLFKRLHGRDVPGTGLGLAICRKVVERHGGRIWVESQPGQGATFLFTLPKG